MQVSKYITWSEAEKLYPGCTVLWDRDCQDNAINYALFVNDYGDLKMISEGCFWRYNKAWAPGISLPDAPIRKSCNCYRYEPKLLRWIKTVAV
jgi:hypothetical protein